MYKRRNKSVSAFTDKQREQQQQQQQIARTRWKATSDRKRERCLVITSGINNNRTISRLVLVWKRGKTQEPRGWPNRKKTLGKKEKKRCLSTTMVLTIHFQALQKKAVFFFFFGFSCCKQSRWTIIIFFGRQEFANHKQCSSKHSSPGCWLAYTTTEKWCLATDEFEWLAEAASHSKIVNISVVYISLLIEK